MRNILLLTAGLLGLLLLTNCENRSPLSGTILPDPEGTWAPVISLVRPGTFGEIATSYMGEIIDSAVVGNDGRFAFVNMPEAPDPVILQLVIQRTGQRYANMLENESLPESNYMPVVWKDGDVIEVNAEASNFQQSFSMVNPSAENKAMLELRDSRQQGYQKFLAGLQHQVHDESALIAEEKALLNFQEGLMAFAKATDYLLPALVAVRWVSPEANYERIPEFVHAQCLKWSARDSLNVLVGELCETGDRERLPVMTGDLIPDFSLPMMTGDTARLMGLLANKITILDLWASWCVPCRYENRDVLVPLWETYHNEGLGIIGYALDNSGKFWQAAIEKDGAGRWWQASHLQGDDSPLFEALRISTIPANFILDEHGKVIAKNLHGHELTSFVDRYIQDHTTMH